jgi:hypothetical protein
MLSRLLTRILATPCLRLSLAGASTSIARRSIFRCALHFLYSAFARASASSLAMT